MILKQGFHLHPKTVMLRTRGGSAAVEALQQLWLFAENARSWRFPNWAREFVAAVGSIYGKPDLADLLTETGFLDAMPGGGYALHDFAEHNAALIQRWENGRFGKLGGEFGKLGGRPRNPRETPAGGSGKPPVGGPKNPPTRPDQTSKEKTLGKTQRLNGGSQPDLKLETDRASAEPKRPTSRKAGDDEAWLQSLESDQTYAGISVRVEFGKMTRWCEANSKKPTRRRFINWLNRAERPMNGHGAPGGELANVEAELRRMGGASMRELQDPGWNKRKTDLERRRAELRGEDKR